MALVESGTNESATDVCAAGDNGGETKFRGRAGGSVTGPKRRWWHGLAVHGVFWRKFVDWGVRNLPSIFHPPLIWIATLLFFFIAAPARKAVLRSEEHTSELQSRFD